jgi:hypothetical protein
VRNVLSLCTEVLQQDGARLHTAPVATVKDSEIGRSEARKENVPFLKSFPFFFCESVLLYEQGKKENFRQRNVVNCIENTSGRWNCSLFRQQEKYGIRIGTKVTQTGNRNCL